MCENTPYEFVRSNKPPFPVDVVYTWAGEQYNYDVRTSNNNELKYSLRSIYKFIPWVNHINIVVNPGTPKPSWFNDNYHDYITLIGEERIFPNSNDIPNKNSNAIEYTIHRIADLSEHYIYFNDDFFIGKPLDYTFFFTSDGKPIVSDVVLNDLSMSIGEGPNHLGFRLPRTINGFYPHVPMPHLKSQCELFEEDYSEYVDWVRSYKTREGSGCDMCKNLICPCQQAHGPFHIYLYKNNKAVARRATVGSSCSESYINSSCLENLDNLLKNTQPVFAIQDTEVNPSRREFVIKKIDGFFQKMYPEKPPWEKV